MLLDLSHEKLSQTHDKKEYTDNHTRFMFHDLQGNPMMVENIHITHWAPKVEPDKIDDSI